jgi:acyl-CoA synthetase (AMP-forming)/AMP-acid ligase II
VSSLTKCLALGTGELIRRIHDEMGIASVCTLYGMSELGPNVTMVHVGEPLETSLRTMGRPHAGIELRMADPETAEPLPAGQVGEICVRGWNLMQGYYKQPDETARVIDAQGWLHTGDLGLLDANGDLVFVGRLKHVVRVGGENVSAEEVEDCLTGHPAVKLAQVVAGPDPRLGEVCVGYVELRAGASATEEELIAHCRERLASFKVPRRIRFVGDWPMTGSGKIQRLQLKEREFAQALPPVR